jgi:hypothetical protein
MTEITSIPTRTIFPGVDASDLDGNRVQHVDVSKSLFSRIVGRTFFPGNQSHSQPAARLPPIDPSVDLQQQRELLAHLESQLAAAKMAAPQSSFTSIADTTSREKQYGRMLVELKDVAGQPFADIPLLIQVLERACNEGLIPAARQRIANLENQLRTPPRPTDEHRRLIATEEKAFRQWGRARQARRKHEEQSPVPQRHRMRGPRPAVGMDFGTIDDRALDRAAAFAVSLPDGK